MLFHHVCLSAILALVSLEANAQVVSGTVAPDRCASLRFWHIHQSISPFSTNQYFIYTWLLSINRLSPLFPSIILEDWLID